MANFYDTNISIYVISIPTKFFRYVLFLIYLVYSSKLGSRPFLIFFSFGHNSYIGLKTQFQKVIFKGDQLRKIKI